MKIWIVYVRTPAGEVYQDSIWIGKENAEARKREIEGLMDHEGYEAVDMHEEQTKD
jgi:hypothetical protein